MSPLLSTSVVPRVAISWHGLPFYAVRLIKAAIASFDSQVIVLATRSKWDSDALEKELGQKIYWLDPQATLTWESIGLPVPNIFFQSGWATPAFNSLGQSVKVSGGQVCCCFDNTEYGSLLHSARDIYWTLKYRHYFDAYWVPGKASASYCIKLGIPYERIYQGFYGADPSIFYPDSLLFSREKRFLYVGQMIKRKGIDTLIQAFLKFSSTRTDWSLHLVGGGPLYNSIPSHPNLVLSPPLDSYAVSRILRHSRCLILPSIKDHWGVVVHEAALSGCALILSNQVGASYDLLSRKNGFTFPPGSVSHLYTCMSRIAELTIDGYTKIYSDSLAVASKFGPSTWANSFLAIISHLAP